MKFKYLFHIVLIITFTWSLCGCGSSMPGVSASPTGAAESTSSPDAIRKSDVINYEDDIYNDYKEVGGCVAMVTDVSDINDNGYNQAAFEGAQIYALAAGVTYSAYSASVNTEEEYLRVLQYAIDNNAELIICAGSHYAHCVGTIAPNYPAVNFLLLDAVPLDASGKALPLEKNVFSICYREEEAGYLAGYMATMDGNKNFGFIGGEKIPAVERYGCGYLQGINDASLVLGNSEMINVKYWYSDTFMPSESVQEMAADWYEGGTQVIFSCGGEIYESILAAADAHDGRLIGVDVDQSSLSKRFITSATKDIQASVITALDDYYANNGLWPDREEDRCLQYGIADKCIELPTNEEAWRFQTVTQADYEQIYSAIKQGTVIVYDDINAVPALNIYIENHNN